MQNGARKNPQKTCGGPGAGFSPGNPSTATPSTTTAIAQWAHEASTWRAGKRQPASSPGGTGSGRK